MMSNKVSLQNQLQNPRASDPEESNEAFDRAKSQFTKPTPEPLRQ